MAYIIELVQSVMSVISGILHWIQSLFSNEVFLGAFWGAVSVFVFERIISLARYYGGILDRKKQHLNSLQKLEVELVRSGEIINDDIYIIENKIKAISELKVYFTETDQIPCSQEYFQELLSLQLINDLNEYQLTVRKVNSDMKHLDSAYEKIRDSFISTENFDFYKANSEFLTSNYSLILLYLKNLMKDLKMLLAKVRVVSRKDRPLLVRLKGSFTVSRSLENTKSEEIEVEIERIDREVLANKEESKLKIDSIKKSVKNAS